MTSARTYQRKQIFIDPAFQMRIALWSGLVAVVEIMLTAVVMMVVILTSVWIPAGFHVQMFTKLALVVGGCVLAFTLVNILVGVVVSHRIAGPVYRLKQSMHRMAEGDVSFLIHLREQDELQDLKDEFNDMISSVRDRLKDLRPPAARKNAKKAGVAAGFPFKLD
jgi:signal transduction histidine kinase